jgi:SAM-dependent methyltransferase
METFDADWLALREPVDRRSRAETLLSLLAEAWRAHGWTRVLDLGSGTGSNLRFLAPRLPTGQEWVLLDRDPDHLRVLGRIDAPKSVRSVTVRSGDLVHEGLAAIPDTHLVTGSALLDLVSEDWLRRLVEACVTRGRAAYFALSYDGEIRWSAGGEPSDGHEEEDPDDRQVREAVNVHQTGDKGLGPALGPSAGAVAERLFQLAGYSTTLLPSRWRLSAADALLVLRLIAGWATAASEVRPAGAARVRAWADRRRALVADGRFTLTVGHHDLLALPPERS